MSPSNSVVNKESHAGRRDIQGLRAVAVLAVVFSHAKVPFFSGGFVGVDVFFVISGFLITGLLMHEYGRSGRISMSNFYARRARRILPASTVVLVCTILIATWILSHDGASTIYDDGFWSSVFMANWHFASVGTDYFSLGSLPSPLQHFWSLAVEEQFYFVWPALFGLGIFAAGKRSKHKVVLSLVLVVVIFASLIWSICQVGLNPTVSYFSTFTRGWELALGALLAVLSTNFVKMSLAKSRIALYSGLVLIFGSIFMFTDRTPWPSFNALVPVAGSLLVIVSGINPEHRNRRGFLTSGFMVWVGGISYALYLWHWPALTLWRWKFGAYPNIVATSLLLIVVFIIAWLSTKFLETPIRDAKALKGKARNSNVLGLSLIAISVCVCLVMAPTTAVANNPVVSNVNELATAADVLATVKKAASDPATQVYLSGTTLPALSQIHSDQSVTYADNCLDTAPEITKAAACNYGDTSSAKSIVLLGDSHAAMWLTAFDTWGKLYKVKVIFFGKSECPAANFTVFSNVTKARFDACDAWRADAIQQIIDMAPSSVVVTGAGDRYPVKSDGTANYNQADKEKAWFDGYLKTIRALKQSVPNIILLGDIPMLASEPTTCISTDQSDVTKCGVLLAGTTVVHQKTENDAAKAAGAALIDVFPWFCYSNVCPIIIDNKVVYLDQAHITKTYAQYLTRPLGDALEANLKN